MESSYLKTFVEVVRCGSFSKAARTLHLSQSAVSRRIQFMEAQYGAELIDRSAAFLVPTEAGRLIHMKGLRIRELEGELADELKRLQGRPPLSFACTRPFGMSFLPAIMSRFMARYEGKVDFRLSFETPAGALNGLRENRHDVIVSEHWDEPDFSPHCAATLGEDEMIFISSPRLGLPSPVVGVDELVRQRLYRRGGDCCSGALLASNMAAIGRDPREFDKVLHYDDLNVIIESVCAGEGIALVSKSLVERRLEEGTLRGHRVEGFRHSRKRTLVYREKILKDQPTRYFIDCIGSAFGLGAERRSSALL